MEEFEVAIGDPTIVPRFAPGQGPTGRVMLLNVPMSSWSVVSGGGSLSTIAGPDGILNAVTWTMGATNTANNFGRGITNTGIVYGKNTWIELDVEQGTGSSVASINITLSDSLSATALCSKTITPSSTWVHYTIFCVPATAPANTPPRIAIFSTTGTAIGQTINLANVRIYQSSQPDGGGVFDNPVRAPYVVSTAEIGNQFTASGCSNSTPVGGAAAGSYKSGTTGTCTVTVTLPTAPNAWACSASDVTTPADTQAMTASTSTSATISGATLNGDTIKFFCMAY